MQAYPTWPGHRIAGRAGVSRASHGIEGPYTPSTAKETPRPPKRTKAHTPPRPPGSLISRPSPRRLAALAPHHILTTSLHPLSLPDSESRTLQRSL